MRYGDLSLWSGNKRLNVEFVAYLKLVFATASVKAYVDSKAPSSNFFG